MHSSRTNKWHRSIAIRLPPSVPQLLVTNATQLVLLDKKKELNSTHRFLLISSRLMPAGGSTQSSQIRSCTSVRWQPAQWAAGGSKASAMVLFVIYLSAVRWERETNGKIMAREPPQKKGMPLHASMPCAIASYHLILTTTTRRRPAVASSRRVRERRRIITPIWFEGGSLRYYVVLLARSAVWPLYCSVCDL